MNGHQVQFDEFLEQSQIKHQFKAVSKLTLSEVCDTDCASYRLSLRYLILPFKAEKITGERL
jgi:hypothetical protein